MTWALGNLAAWAGALDDLENRLDAAARSMHVGGSGGEAGRVRSIAVSTSSTSDKGGSTSDGVAAVGEWTAPSGLGTLPSELAERARDLLHNQRKIIKELEQARSVTLKHLTAVRSVPAERDARASVYLDVNG